MENIFVEPAREYRAPKFSRFGGIAPFSHSSAAPEMFFEKDDFDSILSEDNKVRGHTTSKVKTRKPAVVNNLGLIKKSNAAKRELSKQISKLPVKSTALKKNATRDVKKEKCSE
jgi:hypothetical protein